MHRTALRSYHTTRLHLSSTVRRTLSRASRHRQLPIAHAQHRAIHFTSHKPPHPLSSTTANEPLRSSMYFRRLPVAVVSSLVVGYGAWYSYNGTSPASPAASVTARGYA